MPRYDRYDEWRRGGPYSMWYPGAYWAGAPMFGWGWGWPPYAPMGFGDYAMDYTPRRPPEESPTYGRAGDEAARRYAERRGYDVGYPIGPRRRGGPRPRRYDRGW